MGPGQISLPEPQASRQQDVGKGYGRTRLGNSSIQSLAISPPWLPGGQDLTSSVPGLPAGVSAVIPVIVCRIRYC